MADPRRRVKCPVGECDFTGRIDNAKAHLSIIKYSIKYKKYRFSVQKEKKFHHVMFYLFPDTSVTVYIFKLFVSLYTLVSV